MRVRSRPPVTRDLPTSVLAPKMRWALRSPRREVGEEEEEEEEAADDEKKRGSGSRCIVGGGGRGKGVRKERKRRRRVKEKIPGYTVFDRLN